MPIYIINIDAHVFLNYIKESIISYKKKYIMLLEYYLIKLVDPINWEKTCICHNSITYESIINFKMRDRWFKILYYEFT